jgi:hypothetical protein
VPVCDLRIFVLPAAVFNSFIWSVSFFGFNWRPYLVFGRGLPLLNRQQKRFANR